MNLQIILILTVLLKVSRGLQLTKNEVRSCLGEEVVFTCTSTEGYRLSWHLIVTRDSNIPALTYTFFYHQYETESRRKIWLQPGFRVELEFVSIEPILVSTLSANLTTLITDAEVTCQQSSQVQPQIGHFSLASVPSAPITITNIEYQYGCKDFNLTLSWIPPHDDHRIDYYRLRIDGQSDTVIKSTSYMIDSLSYFDNVTVEIDIVNCAGEGGESYFTVAKGGCLELQTLNGSENSCMKPAGYQTIIECEYDEFPEEIILTCQENGSWTSDPTGCQVGCLIPSFPRNTTTMITNNEVYINVSTNYTAMGSEIQLFCGNQTNGESAGPVFTAVCRENGIWSPDLSSHKCATDQVQPQRHLIHIIIGASAGCGMVLLLTIMCGLLCIIRKLCKKQRHNFPEQIDSFYLNSECQHKLGELNQDTVKYPSIRNDQSTI